MLSHNFLKQTGLFKELTDEELLEIILIGHVKTIKAGAVIFEEGAPGDCLFLIISGSVRISKIQSGTEEALAVLEPRSFFGEMTLFDRGPRSAHAIAHDDAELFVIAREDLINLLQKNKNIAYKFLWAFCETLTERLRTTNEKFQIFMSLANSGF